MTPRIPIRPMPPDRRRLTAGEALRAALSFFGVAVFLAWLWWG